MNIYVENVKVDKNGMENGYDPCVEEFNSVHSIKTDFVIHPDNKNCDFTLKFKGSEKERHIGIVCDSITVFETQQFPNLGISNIEYYPSDNEGLKKVKDKLKEFFRLKDIIITNYKALEDGNTYKLVIVGPNCDRVTCDRITFRGKKPR